MQSRATLGTILPAYIPTGPSDLGLYSPETLRKIITYDTINRLYRQKKWEEGDELARKAYQMRWV